MTGKASSISFETAGGTRVHRIPLEAFPNFWAYAYLVLLDGQRVLIDCGSGTDASHFNLLEGLEQSGVAPKDLTHILLTHGHIDHFGGLSRLRALTEARIGVHELDVQAVSEHEARLALISQRLASFLTQAGVADETRDQLLETYRFTKAIYHSVPVDFTYEAAGMQVGKLELVHLPGHCPGHIALRLDDTVFCGDMVVEGVTPHLSPGQLTPLSGLEHYLESLTRFRLWSRDARRVCNGHDEVVEDAGERIDATRKNLSRRLSQALQALDQPRTVAEVCRAVYGEMRGYNALLVIEKTGAFIEYLYERGLILITNADELDRGGQIVRYRRAREVSDSEILPKEGTHVFI